MALVHHSFKSLAATEKFMVYTGCDGDFVRLYRLRVYSEAFRADAGDWCVYSK